MGVCEGMRLCTVCGVYLYEPHRGVGERLEGLAKHGDPRSHTYVNQMRVNVNQTRQSELRSARLSSIRPEQSDG